MSKIYTKATWVDETLAAAERYDIKEDGGAAFKANMQILLATAVNTAGTELTAARMNNIENGIDGLDTIIQNNTPKATGSNIESLTTNKTLVDADYPLQVFTPTAARDVTLPAVATTNHPFYVINASATYELTVKNAGGSTIGVVAVSSSGSFASDGANWHSFGGGGGTKASAAEVATGTDNAKFVTALAIKNSVNVPNVAPSTSGKLLVSNGTNWTSTALAASQLATAVPPSTSGNVMTSNGSAWTSSPATGGAGGAKFPADGRLTLETGVAISTTDQSDKTTLYYTPYKGNQIGLYNGSSAWTTLTFAELSLNISAYTASKPYDIWIYNNAGTATLDSTVWTDGTTRATALALQDGVYVKFGATTRRYLGTIYMDAASKCQDTTSLRYCWNYYNQVEKFLICTEPTNSWTYTTATWRPSNNSTALGVARVSLVTGVSSNPVSVNAISAVVNNIGVFISTGVGLDSTSVNSAQLRASVAGTAQVIPSVADYVAYLTPGYHYLQKLEISQATGTTTWYGDNGDIYAQTGMKAKVLG